jgi:hypothetical protein
MESALLISDLTPTEYANTQLLQTPPLREKQRIINLNKKSPLDNFLENIKYLSKELPKISSINGLMEILTKDAFSTGILFIILYLLIK